MFYDFVESEIGHLYIEASNKGITSIRIIDEEERHTPRPSTITKRTVEELMAYLNRELKEFTVPVDFSRGTAFQQQVWNQLLAIPYGRTTSYLSVAKSIGNPKSVRAVGLANGQNSIPIIVPCHRVIGSNGSLVGYALGIEIKEKLLCLENPQGFGRQASLF